MKEYRAKRDNVKSLSFCFVGAGQLLAFSILILLPNNEEQTMNANVLMSLKF